MPKPQYGLPLFGTVATKRSHDQEINRVLGEVWDAAVVAQLDSTEAEALVAEFQGIRQNVLDGADQVAEAVTLFQPDLSTLMASTSALTVGSIIVTRAEGYSYQVVASNGDMVTAGGVHLNLLPSHAGAYPIMGLQPVADGVTSDRAIIDRVNIAGRVVDLGGRDLAYLGAAFTPAATFTNGRILTAGSTYDYRSMARRELLTYRYLSGFEPEKFSGTVLRLQPGSCVDLTGAIYVQSLSAIDITLTATGPGGLDSGTITNGEDYFAYIIRNDGTGAISAVLSASITYGGVALPSGWSMIRKLPWGFVYRTATGWGVESGVPDFHLSAWPKPYTNFTSFQMASPFIALNAGNATTWTSVDLSLWLPDNARLARIMCRTAYNTGAGTAYVRTVGLQSVGIPAGMAGSTGSSEYNSFDIRTTSTRTISYQVTGGVTLSIGVMGYSQTEPS